MSAHAKHVLSLLSYEVLPDDCEPCLVTARNEQTIDKALAEAESEAREQGRAEVLEWLRAHGHHSAHASARKAFGGKL